jgi:probable dihydroxyacetone kinase regulator
MERVLMSESLITKKALSQGIKELIKKKNFEKITIADITEICGLNRQTFYYHFQDKYELVNWIYYNEAISVFTQDLTFENWNTNVLQLLTIMKKDAYFYQNTLRDTNKNEFQHYLFCVSKEIFCDIIEHFAKESDINCDDKVFVAEFISYGVVGMITAWAKNGMKQSPEDITAHINSIVNRSKMVAVSRYFQGLC